MHERENVVEVAKTKSKYSITSRNKRHKDLKLFQQKKISFQFKIKYGSVCVITDYINRKNSWIKY